jgi:hypothetical protein
LYKEERGRFVTNIGIPNAFSLPNDGHNDVFVIPAKGICKVNFLKIFNRCGEVVFEKKDFVSNNVSGGWNRK